MEYLPLFFDLKDRHILLVGGGDVALRKARLLTRAGARLTVVAHAIDSELAQLLDLHHGVAILGDYRSDLLLGKTLALAATDNDSLNEQVYHDAIAANIPVNVVDNPPLCTFIFPAIVDRSPIVIGISSGGQSPVLARILRSKLESQIPVSFSRLGELVGRLRDKVKARFASVNERRVVWEQVLHGQVAEKVFAGRDQEAEALLLEQIEAGSAKSQTGEVYLVGAGPGDPDLLTFKALRLMQQADVVLYDRLVSDEILELCRRDADMIYVGKKRDNHAVPQHDINQLLIEHAKAGRRVVRLKGGDPFIFGRGGEELEQLKAAGIPFQVVPGVTAASACSTYGGIPLTHRNYAQSVKFVTGQLKNRTTDLNFSEMISPNQTIVFYMGLHTLELLVQGLLDHGKPADTLIAIVSQGTSAQQRVIKGTLRNIVELQQHAQLEAPAIIIVGEVVALQSQLSWFGQDVC
ncbi:MAG: siroheme synthase CysG [Nitrincola sp.]|nr:siroheme synthase CysG [Nitrincola sp.]